MATTVAPAPDSTLADLAKDEELLKKMGDGGTETRDAFHLVLLYKKSDYLFKLKEVKDSRKLETAAKDALEAAEVVTTAAKTSIETLEKRVGTLAHVAEVVVKRKVTNAAAREIAEKALEDATTKAAEKALEKETAEKAVAKAVAEASEHAAVKKIPVVGVVGGLIFGAIRGFGSGDWGGAAAEVGSGVAGSFAGPGTAISALIDLGLISKDIIEAKNEAEKKAKEAEEEEKKKKEEKKKAEEEGHKDQADVDKSSKDLSSARDELSHAQALVVVVERVKSEINDVIQEAKQNEEDQAPPEKKQKIDDEVQAA